MLNAWRGTKLLQRKYKYCLAEAHIFKQSVSKHNMASKFTELDGEGEEHGDDQKATSNSTLHDENMVANPASTDDEPQTDEGWQVSGSAKRRLAPSHTLSHKDLGADSPRSKTMAQELSKKKGWWRCYHAFFL